MEIRRIVIIALVCVFSANAYAQSYSALVGRNFWNEGINISGIRQDTTRHAASFAELYGGVKGGDFKASFDASFCWNAGVRAATLMHFKRFSLKGGLSFNQMQGDNMKGSMFATPGFFPIDIVEFELGRKIRNTYAFDAGTSFDLSDQLRLGAVVDLNATKYSKIEDLSYRNRALDLKFSPSLQWHWNRCAAGVGYILRYKSENVRVKQLGETVPDAFIDKGMFYGYRGRWTDSQLHLNDDFPINEIQNGAGAQLSKGTAYFDLEYSYGLGHAGSRENPWYRFPSHNVSLRFSDLIKGERFNHLVKISYTLRGLKNFESGTIQVMGRDMSTARISYAMSRGKWDVELYAGATQMDANVTNVTKYKVISNLETWNLGVTPKFHFKSMDLFFGLKYGQGKYNEDNAIVQGLSETADEAYRLDAFFIRYREFFTAPYIQPNLMLKYRFAKGIYVSADASYQRAFNIEYLAGEYRYIANLKVGWDF